MNDPLKISKTIAFKKISHVLVRPTKEHSVEKEIALKTVSGKKYKIDF